MTGRDDWDGIDPPSPEDDYLDEPHDGPSSWRDFGAPLPADGIKARSKRGRIGDSWWSHRFLEFLDDLGHGGRLGRGRSYARAGQVVDLTIGAGEISARVQGSRPDPYDVRLGLDVVGPETWAAVEAELAGRAAYAAALLDGRLPHDFEEVAGRCGAEILPAGGHELLVRCSCPDYETVCKHVAAVCYLAAEAFDDDPFLLLHWRGRTRDELMSGLRRQRAACRPDAPARRGRKSRRGVTPDAAVLDGPPREPQDFWRAGPGLEGIRVRPAAARVADAALAERGPIGLKVGPVGVEDLLRPMYLRITQAAEARAYRDVSP